MTSAGRSPPPCILPMAGIIELLSLSLALALNYPFEFSELNLLPMASYRDLIRSKMLKFALINL